MSFTRARALRSIQSTLTRATPRVSVPRTQLITKRFASGGHGDHAPSSDLPWLLSALVITPVSAWYLWPEPHKEHHGHGSHDQHEEEHEEKEEKAEEEAPEQPEEKEEKPAEESSDSEEKTEEKADESADAKSGEKDSEDDSKSSGAKDSITKKQEGLSNTDTRHSTKPDEAGSGISTKGAGGPETAKHKGSVDPKAPVK